MFLAPSLLPGRRPKASPGGASCSVGREGVFSHAGRSRIARDGKHRPAAKESCSLLCMPSFPIVASRSCISGRHCIRCAFFCEAEADPPPFLCPSFPTSKFFFCSVSAADHFHDVTRGARALQHSVNHYQPLIPLTFGTALFWASMQARACVSTGWGQGGGGKKLRAWKKIAYPPHPPGVACAKKAVPP
jgi:hypothetical protein